MDNALRKLALGTSYALHPLFMPINGLLLAYFFGGIPGFNPYSTEFDKEIAHWALFCVFLGTTVFPVLVAVVLKWTGIVSSLHMPQREERSIPFLLTGISYLTLIYLFFSYWKLPLDPIILAFMRGATFAILIGMGITFSWKISVHMIGIGGIVGILILISKAYDKVLLMPLIITIIAAGLIAFGRLNLKAHTPKQVIAGFSLGLVCELLPLLIG